MEKKYIKMNNNKDYLSLGNVFNVIKKYSKLHESAMQTELFCAIFNVKEINSTTVNNYCIGYRAIGVEYKKKFIDLLDNKKEDEVLLNIISILDEKIYIKEDNILEIINSNIRLKDVLVDCITLAKEDININNNLINEFEELLSSNNLYTLFIRILRYSILDNIQPIYINDFNIEVDSELKEYLKINLFEGISYINSLKLLSKKNNMYANAELGSLEFSGLVNGNIRIEKSFDYYLKAANKNHPKACWMVANLILTNRVESEIDAKFYLNKAIKLGSIAALNTMGNYYKNNNDYDKAMEYYLKASEYGYIYSYNNIGLLYEIEGKIDDALKYFKISADMGESWALNKVGEILRNKGLMKEAFIYYENAINGPISERNYYAYYNLAKYYYLETDIKKAKEYLTIAYEHGIDEAKKILDIC